MITMVSRIRRLTRNASEAARKYIIRSLRDLSISLESSDDTLERLAFTPLQLYGAWIGSDLKLFETLSKSTTPISLETLAKETKTDTILLGRLLRYMASIRLIKETSQDQFTFTNVSKALATPQGENHLELYITFETRPTDEVANHQSYNIVNPALSELPKFLKRTGYDNPHDEARTAFQDAYKFNEPIYAWWAANPDQGAIFNKHMEYKREGARSWLEVFPVERYTAHCKADQTLFVDIGGNMGHQCNRFRTAYPKLTGRVILQDLSYAIESAPAIPGVESMVHDFFTPQPIQGARIYYLRGVLHCFGDDNCIIILRNIATAMAPESIVLVDDAVIPGTDVFWQATQMDLLMMSCLASMERTRPQWETVVKSAGLKISEVYVYSRKFHESVMVLVKA